MASVCAPRVVDDTRSVPRVVPVRGVGMHVCFGADQLRRLPERLEAAANKSKFLSKLNS